MENSELNRDGGEMDEDENRGLSWDGNREDSDTKTCDQNFKMFLSDSERQRRMAAAEVVSSLVQFIHLMDLHYYSNYVDKGLKNNSMESIMVRHQLSVNEKCCDITRMSPLAFANLCELQ